MSTCQAEYVRTPNAQGTLVATGVPHDGPTVAVHPSQLVRGLPTKPANQHQRRVSSTPNSTLGKIIFHGASTRAGRQRL